MTKIQFQLSTEVTKLTKEGFTMPTNQLMEQIMLYDQKEYFKLRIVHGSAVSAAIAARQAPTTQYQAANSMPTGRHHCGSQQALPRFARSVRF